MDKEIDSIGCGDMDRAILGGLTADGQVQPGQIWAYTLSPDKVATLRDQYGINATESAQEMTQIADIVFGAVKLGIMTKVLGDVASNLNRESLMVSIVAGVALEQLARVLDRDRKIIRAIPNTPSLVNASMASVTPNALMGSEGVAEMLTVFRCSGRAEQIAEPIIHPVVGVSGPASAYVFMFIEAMADVVVLGGMPHTQAYKFAAQAVMSSTKVMLKNGEHPGALKSMVYSPGGTTVETVRILEEKGFRSAVIEAITWCMEKSEELSHSQA